jgi:UDP-N-acetylmuramoylalanine--D-glutamate ligase
MAATSVAKLMQIRKATIRESLSNFQGVEHVLKVLKIKMYNISMIPKNVNATFFCIDSMNMPTVWIVEVLIKEMTNELMSLVVKK